jgi:creatinine amidohydrolase
MLLAEMTWPEIRKLVPDTPMVIPLAAVEQHGHHLPLATDSILLGEVVRRVEPMVHDLAIFTPLLWLGNSHHHMEYAGTLSASPRVYLDLVNDFIENLLHHGFKRIIFLNGHGGNITPYKQAIFEARQRHRSRTDLLLLGASYWDFGDLNWPELGLLQNSVGHACELETSMMLAIRPDLVKDFSHLEPRDMGYSFEPAYRGWITCERKPQGADSPGHLGNPANASLEKGEMLLQLFAEGSASFIRRVAAWDGHSWEFDK